MGPLWALLAALTLPPTSPDPAAEPCPTITANVRQDSQVTVPINFTGKTFHLQKRNGTRWENFALCLGSRCHKTSSAVAGVRLRDGKLELSKASAGTYRAQGSLDNACLAHIILHEPTPSPLLTRATSPEPAKSTGDCNRGAGKSHPPCRSLPPQRSLFSFCDCRLGCSALSRRLCRRDDRRRHRRLRFRLRVHLRLRGFLAGSELRSLLHPERRRKLEFSEQEPQPGQSPDLQLDFAVGVFLCLTKAALF
ncbi:uncharacterized protein LOC115337874 isoform X2 [Aquila chrysaetos chrysaetos]|uniref:uncharacterized protein LOC115337874 isoform X2 n=1 Tax=Aquila chrysaetos chrysaetos TaxID=223781 RepID=UPI001176E2DA|nr:uncharacterized protein LOC115337874 isoform X2 [Aquila chrysaetos chrysaetos]